ncbi:MAG: hypothetical protein BMS9Abin33_1233 [Gammaproteobacteria bacterium]|nr:MAG: hypothetical protein BMS9Abin33_1233 [Gammaproteobacteria bacterium]
MDKIAVVIPCYQNRNSIAEVLKAIDSDVDVIYVVDDACPEHTGDYVQQSLHEERIQVIRHDKNQGVGGAMVTGYRQALTDGADIIVKIDADGQMDPRLIKKFIRPISEGRADYTKGNRFYTWECLKGMPKRRLLGNALLSLITKISTGYWDIMDPTNGFTAIHSKVLRILPLDKIDKGYFFETDMLHRLNIAKAMVVDIPMKSRYEAHKSSVNLLSTAMLFPGKHLARYIKRIAYQYFIREFNAGTLQLVIGLVLTIFGISFGAWHWIKNLSLGVSTPTGTIMIAALPVIMGFYSLLGALNYDITNVPKQPLHKLL